MSELLKLADDDGRQRWEGLTLGYTESLGLPALREEIAALYRGVAPEQVVTFAGAQEGIFVAVNALLGAGDHAVVTWPGYQSLYEVARAAGADVTLLPLREERGWELDLDELEAALTATTRLVVVNFPHNPTGSLPSSAVFERLAALCDERGIHLFSDEVYRGLEHRPEEQLPAAAELSPRALSLGVMSKAFGLAGLRVGWIACRDTEVFRRIAAYKDYTTICNSAPSEVLALIALRAKEALLKQSRRIVGDNLAAADAFFARHPHRFSWARPRAGSVAFPKLLGDERVAAFTERLRAAEGVLLLPGDVYDHPGNHFRLGLGRSNFGEALAKLERFILA